MAKGEIVISEQHCRGCGFCKEFCAKGSIEWPSERFNALGYFVPTFAHPETCNACGVCAWMCPHFAIEVYKYVGAET